MARPRVLMLGWEFLPAISGGIGKATYQLAKALSSYVDLTVIIPYMPSEVSPPTDFHLVAVNQLTEEDYPSQAERTSASLQTISYGAFAEVMLVSTELTPYPVPVPVPRAEVTEPNQQPELITLPEHLQKEETSSLSLTQLTRYWLGSGELQGNHLMEKVHAFVQAVLRLVEGKTFDLVHVHDWLTLQAGVAIKHRLRIPLVAHIHSLEVDRSGPIACSAENPIYAIEYLGMLEADWIISVSHYTKNRIIEYYPHVEASKIRVVYNAINPDEALLELTQQVEFRAIPSLPKRKIVLFVGRLTYQKGPEYLLETAEKILARDPEVLFVVVGKGDLYHWLASQIAQKGLGANFILTGFLSPERVASIMQMAHVYFMPSASEPFGLSALEAALAGVPTVISAQSGIAELLQFVLKANYWDTDRFAHYILALLNNPALSQVLAEENRRTVSKMSWEEAATQVRALYYHLLPHLRETKQSP
ncbi:MAG: glycosyltransferase [Cytophagales bacterium]|nr:glycosyltransferase [Bernardetiaceae bacterium]MDW8211664.1 glycosyltransferase [Cytophagales bacterium]